MEVRVGPPAKPLPHGWWEGLSHRRVFAILQLEAEGTPSVMPGLHGKGYVRLYLGRGHPYADKGGCSTLHRWLMSRHLGRRLDTYEHVHHVKGAAKDTLDLDDLEILEDVDHGHYHYGERLGCGREFCTHSAHREPELDAEGTPDPYYQGHAA